MLQPVSIRLVRVSNSGYSAPPSKLTHSADIIAA